MSCPAVNANHGGRVPRSAPRSALCAARRSGRLRSPALPTASISRRRVLIRQLSSSVVRNATCRSYCLSSRSSPKRSTALLLLFQSATCEHAPAAVPALRDEDIAEAAAAAAATLETARKGIIYEHQAVSVPAQRLTPELGKVVADLSAQAGSQQARLERDAAVALRRLEQGARTAAKALDGDEPPVLPQPADADAQGARRRAGNRRGKARQGRSPAGGLDHRALTGGSCYNSMFVPASSGRFYE